MSGPPGVGKLASDSVGEQGMSSLRHLRTQY